MKEDKQKQTDTENEQSEAARNRLVEIYKIHTQFVSDASNRQIAINRFYPTLMSGLLAVFFAFLQRGNEIVPAEFKGEIFIAMPLTIVGYLGMLLSIIWTISIRYYNRLILRKYQVLEELERKLEFRFFAQEWDLSDEHTKNIRYRQIEQWIPFAFALLFFVLIIVGFYQMIPSKNWV